MSDQQVLSLMATILLAADMGRYDAATPVDGAVEMADAIWRATRERLSGQRRHTPRDRGGT